MLLTWLSDLPMVWMTISGPYEMTNGNREYKYDDAMAGNRASSLSNAELTLNLLVLSKFSYNKFNI